MEEILNIKTSDLEKPQKQILWEKQITFLNEIEGWPPIDENIKETIAALNMNGVRTAASCGGHMVDERHTGDTPFPWILIDSPDQSEGQVLHSKAEALLAEFYDNRKAEDDIRLKVGDAQDGQFHLSSLTDEDLLARLANGKLTEEEKSDLAAKLPKRQQEIEDFGQFLKSRFFAGS